MAAVAQAEVGAEVDDADAALAQRGDGGRGRAVRPADERGVDVALRVRVPRLELQRHARARVDVVEPRAGLRARGHVGELEERVAVDEHRRDRARVAAGAEHGEALGTELPSDLVAQRGDDLRPPLRDLLVGQRAVGRAELEPDRERARGPRRPARRGRRRTPRRRAAARRRRRGRPRARARRGRRRRRRPRCPGGPTGTTSGPRSARRAARGGEHAEVELEAGHRAVEVPGGGDGRVQLAEPAGAQAVADDAPSAARRGMQERLACASVPTRNGMRRAPSIASSTPLAAKKSARGGSGVGPARRPHRPVSSAPRCGRSAGSSGSDSGYQ